MKTPTRRRVEKLAGKMRSEGIQGVIIAPGPNMEYYAGVRSQLLERPFLLVIQADQKVQLLAPELESGPFRRSPLGIEIHAWTDNEGPAGAFDGLLAQMDKRSRWGCEGRVPFGFVHHLLAKGIKAAPADEVLQSIREIKDIHELDLIRRSALILSDSYKVVPELVEVGMTERQLSRKLTEEILSKGAETVEPCMVQS